jgi:hypothetical protein
MSRPRLRISLELDVPKWNEDEQMILTDHTNKITFKSRLVINPDADATRKEVEDLSAELKYIATDLDVLASLLQGIKNER